MVKIVERVNRILQRCKSVLRWDVFKIWKGDHMLKLKYYILIFLITSQVFADHHELFTYIQKYLPENAVILEAGVFNGIDSLHMARFWPQAKIHGFEPIPELFAQLPAVQKHAKNIAFYQVALGDKIGTMPMYLSAYDTSPDVISASSSLLPPKEHLVHAPEVLFNRVIEVPVTTIDAWAQENNIDHIDFMWLDMQGYELHALMAAPKILKTVRVILLEVEFVEAYKGQYLFNDIKLFLENNGFTCLGLTSNYGWCGDALFVKI